MSGLGIKKKVFPKLKSNRRHDKKNANGFDHIKIKTF